jgi:ABC-2 type transport system permease protein
MSQFFLVGVSWPREMIPPVLDYIRRVFPSESAIDGLVRINQMGAALGEVRADWLYLWLLAAIYFGLAVGGGASTLGEGRGRCPCCLGWGRPAGVSIRTRSR